MNIFHDYPAIRKGQLLFGLGKSGHESGLLLTLNTLKTFPLTGALEDLKGRSGCGNMMSLVNILLEAEKPLM